MHLVSKAGSVISITCFQMERYLIHRALDHSNIMFTHFLPSTFCKSMKMYHTAPGFQQWLFCPPLLFRIPTARYVVITSLLEQAPDWLTRREFSPKLDFSTHAIRANHALRASNARNAQFVPRHSRESLHSRRLIRANRTAGCQFASLHWLNM